MVLHPDILTISYRHRAVIRRAFSDAIGFQNIIHFSLDLVRPDGQMIFFSSTPSHGYEVCSKGYGAFDSTISPEYYQNREFYWWSDVRHKRFSREIEYIKRVRHGFRSGFMMVRHWDDFHFVYSFAFNKAAPDFIEQAEDNRDQYFALGDHVYNLMRPVYFNYTDDYVPPKVNHFYPYQGGKPHHHLSQSPVSERTLLLPRGVHVPRSEHEAQSLKLIVDNPLSTLS